MTIVASDTGYNGVTATEIFVDGTLVYSTPSTTVKTSLVLTAGSHELVATVVYNGGSASSTPVVITVAAPPTPTPTATPTSAPTSTPVGNCTTTVSTASALSSAASSAAAGSVVCVSPGTYSYGGSDLQVSASGKAGSYVTLTCTQPGACTITNSVTGNATVVYLTGNYITFNGFEVTNSGSGNNLGFYVTGSNINITDNTIHHIETDCGSNGGGGIQLASNVSNIVMSSNLIYDISWESCYGKSSVVQTDGILAETDGSGIKITDNIVYHVAGGWGIMFGNSSGNANPGVITNNTVFSNANGEIGLVNGGSGSTISNNIVVDNGVVSGQCGIWAVYADTSGDTVANNDVYGNTGGNYCSISSTSGGVSIDPAAGTTFVNWQADGSGNYQSLLSGIGAPQ